MTCIIGFIDKQNKIMYMGGDSAGVAGLDIRIRKDIKVFQKGEMLFGYTSSFRMGQLLRFKLNIPQYCTDKEIYEYMCTDFIDAVRTCLIDNGYAKKENNVEEVGVFLVAFKGRLFRIDNDLQVGENNYNYDSCGCGENYALGSIRTNDYYNTKILTPTQLMKDAFEVTTEFSGGVRPPFNIISLQY